MLTYRLHGARKLGETVEFDDATVFLSYPSPTTWQADVVLDAGRTEYDYRVGSSVWQTLTIADESTEPVKTPARNIVDEWGVLFDTKRLPDESNSAYRARLLDVFKHRGSASFAGVLNSSCRDLGLNYNDRALIIRASVNPTTGAMFDSVEVQVGPRYVEVSAGFFRVDLERAEVEPATGLVYPSKMVSSGLRVRLDDGTPVSFTFQEGENAISVPEDLGGKTVLLSYSYMEKIDRFPLTLQQLANSLEALETPWGDQVLDVTVYAGLESKSARKLSIVSRLFADVANFDAVGESVTGIPVRWSDMILEAVWDKDVQDYDRNWTGSLWNTRVDSAHMVLRDLSKMSWGTAIADESVWGTDAFPMHGGQVVDCIYDPPFGHWEDVSGNHYDLWQAAELSGLSYRGLPSSMFQSGTGGIDDMKVVFGSNDVVDNDGTEGRHFVAETDDEVEVPANNLPTGGGVEFP